MSWVDGDATGGDEKFGSGSDGGTFESTISDSGPARSKPKPAALPDATAARENPFDVFRDRRDQALAKLRNPPGFENTAIFTWGEGLQNIPSTDLNGGKGLSKDFLDGTGFKTVDDKNGKNPTNPNKGAKEWSEVKRIEKVIKVASEEDPETYIKVKVAQVSVIQTHEGVVVMKWAEPSAAPGAGVSSSETDEDEEEEE